MSDVNQESTERLDEQARLEICVRILEEEVSKQAVEHAEINPLSLSMPTLIISKQHWYRCAEVLKNHEQLKLTYLRSMAGADLETHMEVIYHLTCIERNTDYCFKVKTDRDTPSVPSVTSIWPAANWNEREIYDLLGIQFPGHPNLKRIMMPDDWEGHPLRKDYEPLDPEV